ncbi:MAG: sigma-54 dependent transcriptional regulator [Syntrophales bacterium]|nr:sigma-54 dependent transcriptional regulator [Syntrophales bacterium]
MKKLEILVVEDGKSQREMLRDFLAKEGYMVREAASGEEALDEVRAHYFDVVLLDYKMPGMDGMQVLKEVKRINQEIDVVIITAYGTIETAVEAMKAGALDYITKPVDFEELTLLLDRVQERRVLIRENELLRQELRAKGVTTDQIVYRSAVMESIVNMVSRVAPSKATILLQGESGTGKELFARLIHQISPRSSRPMLTVNCGALNENLLESELFGHERGAFTGAVTRRIGRVEEADGGTLFLDEVGDLPLSIQVKLLRFLQDREFQRLGGNQTLFADVRIVSATNRDLEKMVKEGKFREDLYYRLNVVNIKIPPLRERKEDIPPLIDHFVEKYARENGKEVVGLSGEARDLLLKYDYPGNVRELENIIERAVVIARDEFISVEDLPFGEGTWFLEQEERKSDGLLKNTIEELEKKMILEAMVKASHNQTRAAEILGISERMLRYKLKKYNLKGF